MYDPAAVTGESLLQQRHLVVLYATTKIISDSKNLFEVADDLLPTMGEGLSWHAAQLWQLADKRSGLRYVQGWYDGALPVLAAFNESHRSIELPQGESLAGRVWRMSAPLWIEDFGETQFGWNTASAFGLRSAL